MHIVVLLVIKMPRKTSDCISAITSGQVPFGLQAVISVNFFLDFLETHWLCHLFNPLREKLASNLLAMRKDYRQPPKVSRLLIYKISSFQSKSAFDQ